MNRLLTQDLETFERLYPDAVRFLNGAHLRSEAFSLMHKEFKSLNQWQKNRLAELNDLMDQKHYPVPKWFRDIREVWVNGHSV